MAAMEASAAAAPAAGNDPITASRMDEILKGIMTTVDAKITEAKSEITGPLKEQLAKDIGEELDEKFVSYEERLQGIMLEGINREVAQIVNVELLTSVVTARLVILENELRQTVHTEFLAALSGDAKAAAREQAAEEVAQLNTEMVSNIAMFRGMVESEVASIHEEINTGLGEVNKKIKADVETAQQKYMDLGEEIAKFWPKTGHDHLVRQINEELGFRDARIAALEKSPGSGARTVPLRIPESEKVMVGKLSGDEKSSEGFADWRKVFDLHVDSVWNGLFEVLQKIRDQAAIVEEPAFNKLVDEFGRKKPNHDPSDWMRNSISRHMYKILYDNSTLNARGIVEMPRAEMVLKLIDFSAAITTHSRTTSLTR